MTGRLDSPGSSSPEYRDELRIERGLHVFQFYAAPCTQARSCRLNPIQESWIVLQAIIEPIVLRFTADEPAGRLTMRGNHNFLLLRLAKKARQIVLHF